MKKRLFTFVLVFMQSLCLWAKDDWQNWSMLQIQAKAHEKITLRLQTEHWLTQNFSKFSLSNVDGGFLWRPVKYFEAGPFYRYQYVDSLQGPNTGENRIYIEASLRYPAEPWVFSNRSRIEYREMQVKDFWTYRNETRITRHFTFKKLRLSPYISEEWFFHSNKNKVAENRASVGWQTRFHENAGVTLFYLIRHTETRQDWKSDQVLGATLHLYI